MASSETRVDPYTAAVLGHIPTLRNLVRHDNINKRNRSGWTILMYACHYEKLDVVQYLVRHGADVSLRCYNGRTALMMAAVHGKVPILQQLYRKDILGYRDNDGKTALFLAVEHVNLGAVEFLLSKGADPNVLVGKTTCLMFAAKRGHFALARVLLRYKANTKIRNSQGKTAKQLADENGFADIYNLISTYEEANIGSILKSLGFEEYAPNFKRHQITFDLFLQMTEEDMKDIGITVFGRRRKLAMFLNQIKGCYDGLF